MQDVFRTEILPNAHLTCIGTEKFKTGCLSVTLITKLRRSTAALNAVLPKVLRRGTASLPDMERIGARLDELYGARIEPVVRKKGEVQCVGFYADFADDAYLPEAEGILEKTALLLGEMLLAPSTRNGRLREEYVESERENLIDEIRTEINDKRTYSVHRLTELMCRGERYAIQKLGSVENARKITVGTLTKQYRQLLSSAAVEFVYCGSAEHERVERAIRDAFAAIPRGTPEEGVVTDVRIDPKEKEPRVFTETLDVTQGKLAIGFRVGESMKMPNYAAMMVFNAVYGGAVTSKLFLNVREKQSLCYYAGSFLEKHKGVMIVSSGIEFDKYDQALAEILLQLDAVKRGEIESWELESARRAVIHALKTALDHPGLIEDFFLDQSLLDIRCTPDELAALADDVTREDVMKIAAGVKTDAVYFLTGERTDGDEA